MSETIYTAEVVEDMISRYVELRDSGADYDTRAKLVREFADELGVKIQSVIGKLSAEKVYKAKEPAKTGTASRTKEQIADAFTAVIGEDMTSLSKANKETLVALWKFVTDLNSEIEVRAQELANTQ